MASTLAATAWILELGIRVTLRPDGIFATLRGMVPDIDPMAVHYVTDRTVGNLAAKDGTFRIIGDKCSPTRLAALIAASPKQGLDKALTLQELSDHAHLGKGWTPELVINAYKAD